jgi:hypothetical protein
MSTRWDDTATDKIVAVLGTMMFVLVGICAIAGATTFAIFCYWLITKML